MFGRILYAPEGEAAPSGAQPITPPAAIAPPAATVVTPPAPAQVPAVAPSGGAELDPSWLNPRLERERRTTRAQVLRELGVENEDAAKAAIAAARAAEDAKKTTDQRLLESTTRLATIEAERVREREAIKVHVDAQMAGLTPERQATVRALAPDADPSAQLRTIALLAPTWGVAAALPVATATAQPAAAPGTPPPSAPLAPPASGTAPPPNAPASGGPISPPNRKAEYEAMKQTNPHGAAVFLNKYSAEIYPPH